VSEKQKVQLEPSSKICNAATKAFLMIVSRILLISSLLLLFDGNIGAADTEAGYLAPEWKRQEFDLGDVSWVISWCGEHKLVVAIDGKVVMVNLIDNSVQPIDSGFIYIPSLSCSGDGEFASFLDRNRHDLIVAETSSLKVMRVYQGYPKATGVPVFNFISPHGNFLVGLEEFPDHILLGDRELPVVKIQAGIGRIDWDHDESRLYWKNNNWYEFAMMDIKTKKPRLFAPGVKGFIIYDIKSSFRNSKEVYLHLEAKEENFGNIYRFSLGTNQAQVLVADVENTRISISDDDVLVFSRSDYPKNKPGFEKNPHLAIPLAAEIYLFKDGKEYLVASIKSEFGTVQPFISKSGNQIAYSEIKYGADYLPLKKTRRLVILRRVDQK